MGFFDFFKRSMRGATHSSRSTRDIAIDLGTANTVVYVKGEGILIDEPTYVAINIKTDEVEHIGEKAKEITLELWTLSFLIFLKNSSNIFSVTS